MMVLTMGVGLQHCCDVWNQFRHQSTQVGPANCEGASGPHWLDEHANAAGRIWWASYEITPEWE